MFDEQCFEDPRHYGWWITPSGEVIEGTEIGFHGIVAMTLLKELHEINGFVYLM